MANPTTNYSFAMPTNTDLVKDLPADFEIFGQAVDTQMKTNADAAIAKTIVDAKGDIIAATAADTVSRLAVGANNTVLTADSSTATGLKWATAAAGGMTLLSTTTLSGTSTTVSNIDQTYKSLLVRIFNPSVGAVTGYPMCIRINSVSTSSYSETNLSTQTTTVSNTSSTTQFNLNGCNTDEAATSGIAEFYLPDYSNSGNKKMATYITQNNSTNARFFIGNFNSAVAVTSLRFFDQADNSMDGGTVEIYGVK
jgi:hypothetical protein